MFANIGICTVIIAHNLDIPEVIQAEEGQIVPGFSRYDGKYDPSRLISGRTHQIHIFILVIRPGSTTDNGPANNI